MMKNKKKDDENPSIMKKMAYFRNVPNFTYKNRTKISIFLL